jgi:hypothetical protein
MRYEVFFEINGKKMRTKVDADNAFDAMNKTEKKMGTKAIYFYKTVRINDVDVDFLKDFFGMK